MKGKEPICAVWVLDTSWGGKMRRTGDSSDMAAPRADRGQLAMYDGDDDRVGGCRHEAEAAGLQPLGLEDTRRGRRFWTRDREG